MNEQALAKALFAFFQKQDASDLNERFSDFAADGILGTEEYEKEKASLEEECAAAARFMFRLAAQG